MDRRISECLRGEYGSYILPFLWLRGEPHERVYQEILAIRDSGITEFCAESRPYENFCKSQWWEDFGFILKTSKDLGMKVWLLDDRLFPTGYANGYLEAPERENLRKVQIREIHAEVLGPKKACKILIDGMLNRDRKEEVISVIAYKHRDGGEELIADSAIDLTDTYEDGTVYFNVPDGVWRVCTMIKTDAWSDKGDRFSYYIDMLNPESCRAMVKAVYEPQYEHFKEYFGTTFRGFFSDEPGFMNIRDTYLNELGIFDSVYPWRDDLPELISKSAGVPVDKIKKLIPAMWEDLGDDNALFRTHYMEVCTKLFEENFSMMLGDWCREHGVMHIGHLIEDNNVNMRLGYGAGHYFRGLSGDDMGGMDIVLNQIIPGITDNAHHGKIADQGYMDPHFFHYALPKLCSSHAHLDPKKKGRAMCEIFGAFGWAEGLTFMKHLTDVMLVSGINHYVPHAFSCKENDPDCPPHFWNNGKNQQYPLFKELMAYMGRCSHVLNEGTHKASVAVFYNAEGYWTSGKNELYQEVCVKLTKGLIDYDIVPFDMLNKAEISGKKLKISNEEFGALIVSESEVLPIKVIEKFYEISKMGVPVIFTNSLPKKSAEGQEISNYLKGFDVVKTEDIADNLRKRGIFEISANTPSALRFYHIKRDNSDTFMFYNDDVLKDLDTEITFPYSGDYVLYDPWGNKCYKGSLNDGKMRLFLEKGNSIFITFGGEVPEELPDFRYEKEREILPISFDIYVKDEGEEEFSLYKKDSTLVDITSPKNLPHFSGEILYKGKFFKKEGYEVLDLGEVGETAEVFLNGERVGVRINAPFKFDIKNAMEGENQLEIRVINNPAHKRRDVFSHDIFVPPSGMLGDIYLCKY